MDNGTTQVARGCLMKKDGCGIFLPPPSQLGVIRTTARALVAFGAPTRVVNAGLTRGGGGGVGWLPVSPLVRVTMLRPVFLLFQWDQGIQRPYGPIREGDPASGAVARREGLLGAPLLLTPTLLRPTLSTGRAIHTSRVVLY